MHFLFILLPLFFSSTLFAKLHVDVGATSAILINSKTGKVLFEKNALQPMYPASCTKIAFALYAIKHYEHLFEETLKASNNALKCLPESQKSKNNFNAYPSYILETDASHMGLKLGEEMSFYDLLEATMVVSADDASNVLAEVMGNGSIQQCVENVNQFVASLGLVSTRFMNPHGLHHPEHVTTAHDLAKLSQEAMKEPLFQKIAKTPRFLRPKTNKQPSTYLQSTNRLIVKGSNAFYAPAIGIKTGYHRRAGYCLVAAAENQDRSLIAVVLQGASRDARFGDTKKLFQAAFSEKKIATTYLQAGSQSFSKEIEGGKSPIVTYSNEPVSYAYYPSDEPDMRLSLVWDTLSVPVKKDSPVATLILSADGHIVKKTTLFAASTVEETLFYKLEKKCGPYGLIGLAILASIALVILAFVYRRF